LDAFWVARPLGMAYAKPGVLTVEEQRPFVARRRAQARAGASRPVGMAYAKNGVLTVEEQRPFGAARRREPAPWRVNGVAAWLRFNWPPPP